MTHEVSQDSKIAIPEMVYFTKVVHHDGYDRISPLRPELSAQGKNIVVTGGGTGIGRSIASNFVLAGAKSVSILGRREDRLKSAVEEMKTTGQSKLIYKVVDLKQRQAVDEAFNAIVAEVGKIDVLVSNAGALPGVGPVAEADATILTQGFEINVLTAFNVVQAFLSVMATDPKIINISSAVAHIAPMPGTVSYSISKAANLKMMDYFAAENPGLHIVNVQPGTVQTDMAVEVGVKAPDTVALPGQFSVWLASPEAAFLKSKFVWANWDVDELMARAEEIKTSRLFTWLLDGVPM